jgi:hypothetical protein
MVVVLCVAVGLLCEQNVGVEGALEFASDASGTLRDVAPSVVT